MSKFDQLLGKVGLVRKKDVDTLERTYQQRINNMTALHAKQISMMEQADIDKLLTAIRTCKLTYEVLEVPEDPYSYYTVTVMDGEVVESYPASKTRLKKYDPNLWYQFTTKVDIGALRRAEEDYGQGQDKSYHMHMLVQAILREVKSNIEVLMRVGKLS